MMIPLFLAVLLAPPANVDEALKRLVDGNERYVQDKLTCPNRTQERREALSSQQNPFAVIVGCSDSRVAPEIVFDQGTGDLFVVRVAGNVIGNTELESTSYSVNVLGSTLVLVLGHANCGAVQAVLDGKAEGIPTIAEAIRKGAGDHEDLAEEIKNNARASAKILRESAPLRDKIAAGKLKVLAGYYDLNTGKVELLKD